MRVFLQMTTKAALALAGACLLSACTTTSPIGAAASVARTYASPVSATGLDWKSLLPPPPIAMSDGDRGDMQAVRGYQTLRGSPRWEQAMADASLDMMQAYRPVIGPDFTAARRPAVVALLAYAGKKFSVASNEAKATFPRLRPFQADTTITICVSEPPAGSSYPSGHAGWGHLSADILAALEPAKADAIRERGKDYGQSRVVCGVHFPSDVEIGGLVGDVVLARLNTDPEYQRLFAQAQRGN